MSDTDLDLLVLGSGVAGLSAAVRAADTHKMRVGVLTKGELPQATTRWAQGGVAAVLHGDPDSTDLHLADTLQAGAGLCDAEAVRVLVDEGPIRVNELIALGAMFDRDARGELELAREGGHTLARIVHAGGSQTGAEVERALVEAVQATMAAIYEHAFALELIVEAGRCRGITARFPDGSIHEVRATNVLVTTGGAGQLYAVTTNPLEATGDGIAMALRAGVAVADIEFTQFHPTALSVDSMPRPLLTEALRGHGALLRDTTGERFVDELQPRDVVSRAETRRMLELGADHVFLDATGLEQFDQRFPNIAKELRAAGLDPAKDWLPVAPAAHYTCGGIVTDLSGASSLPGLWAAGEVVVLGRPRRQPPGVELAARGHGVRPPRRGGHRSRRVRAGGQRRHAHRARHGPGPAGPRARRASSAAASSTSSRSRSPPTPPPRTPPSLRAHLQRELTTHAGVLRDAASLEQAAKVVDHTNALPRADTVADHELRNLATVGRRRGRRGPAGGRRAGAPTPARTSPQTSPDFAHRIVFV